MTYIPSPARYDSMHYRRCGKSGLLLPALSLGLWHNFGDITPFGTQRDILRTVFDCGITHFDLANNYGPPYGEAERNFGIHMLRDFKPHRDELVISTKAGYDMEGALRRPRQPQIPDGQPGPEPEENERRLCRHLLPPPPRPRYPD